jgi:hypothetical protein
MAKTSGLNVRIYAEGYDLNTDVNSLSGVGYSQELLDTTALATTARSRIIGTNDSALTVNGWFDNGTLLSHALWTSNSGKKPVADQEVIVALGTSIGDPTVCITAKQASYDISRAPASAIATTVEYIESDGNGAEFGVLLTADKQTDGSATDTASVDNGASSAGGLSGFISAMSLASGSVTVKIQHSTNDSSWSDLVSFTAITGQTAERISVTGTVNRYLRISTSGTFSNLVFVVSANRL